MNKEEQFEDIKSILWEIEFMYNSAVQKEYKDAGVDVDNLIKGYKFKLKKITDSYFKEHK